MYATLQAGQRRRHGARTFDGMFGRTVRDGVRGSKGIDIAGELFSKCGIVESEDGDIECGCNVAGETSVIQDAPVAIVEGSVKTVPS